jgi:hypothetical protein
MAGVTLEARGTATAIGHAVLTPYLRQPSGRLKVDPLAEEMVEYLPTYMQDGFVVRAIQEAIGQEYTKAFQLLYETADQFFVATATWGLDLWEEMLGLPVRTGDLDYPGRRGIILAALRGRSMGSEYAFKQLLEDALGAPVIINPYEPAVKPYTIEIESQAELVENAPMTHPMAADNGLPGDVTGNYIYKVTYVFRSGETDAGLSESNPVSVTDGQVELTNVPVSLSDHAIGRRIYRRHYLDQTWQFVGEIPNNTEITYTDNVSRAAGNLNAVMSESNTAFNVVGLRLIRLIQLAKPAHIHVELRGEAFRASINAAGDRV